jgi:LPS-assembly protein
LFKGAKGKTAFALAWLCGPVLLSAADLCPAPPKYSSVRPTDIAADDHRLHMDADDFSGHLDIEYILKGHVTVRQDERSVEADSVIYDPVNQKVTVNGKVNFLDPRLRIRSEAGSYEQIGNANFNTANFELLDRNGRGFAKDINLTPDGKIDLSSVRYTSCPAGNEDWLLQASSIKLDTKEHEGVAHNVIMRFKDVPVFYTPYISFPLGEERKSGVLFPNLGHSSSNGWEVQVPYYFNLAPNYDLTVTPGILSARGAQLAENFRFLTHNSHGEVDATFLPNDKVEHGDRSYFRVTDVTDVRPGLRFDADISSVSDSNYFLNFAVGSDQTSVTYLERRSDVYYYDDYWRIRGELQNFQTIYTQVADDQRPYSRLPRIQANGLYPIGDSHFELILDSEAVDFVRTINPDGPRRVDGDGNILPAVNPSGFRLNLSPEIRYSYRGPGYFFEPAVGFDFTQYDLHDAGAGLPSAPTRALPYARLDAGLVFEREAGSHGQRTQTLEPRIVYSYVPYRNQDSLPVFDSGLPDLNLTELFRTNRYVGYDRIGDANQVALALTTRLFDHETGAQFLSATIGQIRYFSIPRVNLIDVQSAGTTPGLQQQMTPMNPLSIPGALMTWQGQSFAPYPNQYYVNPSAQAFAAATTNPTNTEFPASDIVAEIALTGYKHVSVNLDYQLNPYTQHTDKSEISLQYRKDPTRVVNLGYRFQEGASGLKLWDASFSWPIANRWNTVGRWVYSLADRKTIEQVAGFEYKSCCYRIQLVQRRYVSNRLGGLDTSIALQLELTGLSSVGKRADSFLEQSIRGYSTRDPNTQ